MSEHPTLRGFLIIAAIAAVVVALSLQPTIAALYLIAQIAFFLAIAFFVFLMWRERRDEISVWPRRAFAAFYGARDSRASSRSATTSCRVRAG